MTIVHNFANLPDGEWFAAQLPAVATASPVPSPCVQVCLIDEYTGICCGCRRTLDEIAAWSRLGDDEKRLVWQQLPGREPPV